MNVKEVTGKTVDKASPTNTNTTFKKEQQEKKVAAGGLDVAGNPKEGTEVVKDTHRNLHVHEAESFK